MTRPLARSTGVHLPRHLPLPAHALTMMLCCPLISSFQIASCSSVPINNEVETSPPSDTGMLDCVEPVTEPVLNDALGMFFSLVSISTLILCFLPSSRLPFQSRPRNLRRKY